MVDCRATAGDADGMDKEDALDKKDALESPVKTRR
jgi:hypothetical protein